MSTASTALPTFPLAAFPRRNRVCSDADMLTARARRIHTKMQKREASAKAFEAAQVQPFKEREVVPVILDEKDREEFARDCNLVRAVVDAPEVGERIADVVGYAEPPIGKAEAYDYNKSPYGRPTIKQRIEEVQRLNEWDAKKAKKEATRRG